MHAENAVLFQLSRATGTHREVASVAVRCCHAFAYKTLDNEFVTINRHPIAMRGWIQAESCNRRSRKAFNTTETELKLIAAAAIIGLSSNPKNGYSTPAAIGTPSAL
jgi:hypothetical protein